MGVEELPQSSPFPAPEQSPSLTLGASDQIHIEIQRSGKYTMVDKHSIMMMIMLAKLLQANILSSEASKTPVGARNSMGPKILVINNLLNIR